MKNFNSESIAAMNIISKFSSDIIKSNLCKIGEFNQIEGAAHSIVLDFQISGWSKVQFMQVNGFLFAFSDKRIFWQSPFLQVENKFVKFEFTGNFEETIANQL